MNPPPVSSESANETRLTALQLLIGMIALAVFVMAGFAWIDSRTTPTIIFLATPDTRIAADVRGAVSTPGVVRLVPGSRMIDAIDAAGGLSPDADQSLINLSARVSDGQMIVIPTQAPADTVSADGRVNINTASVDQLKQLPGIGDVLAQRIVLYREFNGPFMTPGDLENVEGISPALVESLLPYITVTGDD